MDLLNFGAADIYSVLLVSFRTGAFLMTVPIFGHVSIPGILRIWLIIILSLLIYPAGVVPAGSEPKAMTDLVLVIFSELAVGFLMGFVYIMIFSAVQFAGHFIGIQMGLAVSNVFDPMGSGQISLIANFYYLFSILIFLLIDGHHMVISALIQSFKILPIGTAVFNSQFQDFIIRMSVMVFVFGVKFAAPVVITILIINTLLGILSRTVPQMNIFVVGYTITIAIGLLMIWVSLPVFYMVLTKSFNGVEKDIIQVLRLLRG